MIVMLSQEMNFLSVERSEFDGKEASTGSLKVMQWVRSHGRGIYLYSR